MNICFLSFCRLGIYVRLSWYLLLRVYHASPVKLLAQTTVISRLNWGWQLCLHSHGCWQASEDPLPSSLMSLLAGLRSPPHEPLSRFPECPYNVATDPRESQTVPKMEPSLFIANLSGDIHHLCCIIFVRIPKYSSYSRGEDYINT